MRIVTLLFVAVIVLTAHLSARAAVIDDRMSVVEAIDAIRATGIEVAYSTRLVKPWMRVRQTPMDGEHPVTALRETLAVYGLTLERGPGERWLVVRGERPTRNQSRIVSGRVLDADSGEPVAGAGVRARRTTVRTDAGGRYEITLPAGDVVNLTVSADGYVETHRRLHSPTPSAVLDIGLTPRRLPTLEEITIVASQHSLFAREATSGQFLTGAEIRLMPHIADDAFRALHRLPGVAASDFRAPFNLRGGTRDEVKVVLDGLELFEPYHIRTLYSPLSIIDPGIIAEARVLSGGFTAAHGNHMSGVIDIASAVPEDKPVHQLGVSFVSSFARTSGPLASGRGSYLLSARRGYLDLITERVVDDGEKLEPRYSDVFAKVNYAVNDTTEVSVHVLSAFDDVHFLDMVDGEDVSEDSSLNYAWITAATDLTPGLDIRNMVFAGRVRTTETGQLSNPPFEHTDRDSRRVTEIGGLQSDLRWEAGDRALWKFGARYRRLTADYDYYLDALRQTDFVNGGLPARLIRDIDTTRDGDEFGAYGAFRSRTGERLTWELGVRWDKQTYTDLSDETQISPRLNGLYSLGDRTDLRWGWGRYHEPQAIQDLQVEDGETDYYPAQQAEQRVAGITHRFPAGLQLQADVYEKRYSDLRARYENALDTYQYPPESNFDRVRIAPDSARTRGIEITLRDRHGTGLDWWVNYTWSQAEDSIDGVDVRRSWDQRHAVTANIVWRGPRWSVSAIARYHSGWPRTPLLVLPLFNTDGNFIGANADLSQRNTDEFDAYSRLDLRFSRKARFSRSSLEYYFEIYNVFDASNDCCIPDHDLQFGPPVTASAEVDEFLPFFPSFGFVWTFGPGAG